MVESTSVPLSAKSQKSFIAYYKRILMLQKSFRDELVERLESVDKAYQREVDETKEHNRAKAANKLGDTDKLQNVTIPVIMPQVETAVTYQTSVFLTGSPIFGAVAEPKYMDEAMQMETIIEENSVRGGWTRQIMMFFRDGYKHNFAPLEVTWGSEVSASIKTSEDPAITEGVPTELLWSGNVVKRLDPYNTIIDPRVAPTEAYKKAEFIGYIETVSKIELKQIIASLPDKLIPNIAPAFESTSGNDYYFPTVNSSQSSSLPKRAEDDWFTWAGLDSPSSKAIQYKSSYELTTLYCRILPSEFSLQIPKGNTPQIYKLLIVNGSHIIYAERQTNAHNYIPIFIGQPKEDGLGYQTKSVATDVLPFQETASAFMNSIIHSKRRAVTDRLLYDPSRISEAHINSSNPSAKIPVRSTAYGKNISDAVYQFPFRDDQAGSAITNIQQLLGLANQLTGQNQASQGQFVKGNKTLREFESVMQNANGRDQLDSILLEAQVFTPLKEILKLNILQYQGGIELYNRSKQVAIEVDPLKLRKAVLNFKISDGLIPAEKLINGETFSVALQVLGSSPQIAANYNIAQVFSYFMKTQGANIGEFEKSAEQVTYEQGLQAWQSAVVEALGNGAAVDKLPPQPVPEAYGYKPVTSPAPNSEEGNTSETDQATETSIIDSIS